MQFFQYVLYVAIGGGCGGLHLNGFCARLFRSSRPKAFHGYGGSGERQGDAVRKGRSRSRPGNWLRFWSLLRIQNRRRIRNRFGVRGKDRRFDSLARGTGRHDGSIRRGGGAGSDQKESPCDASRTPSIELGNVWHGVLLAESLSGSSAQDLRPKWIRILSCVTGFIG